MLCVCALYLATLTLHWQGVEMFQNIEAFCSFSSGFHNFLQDSFVHSHDKEQYRQDSGLSATTLK